jgi:hypothetical protein
MATVTGVVAGVSLGALTGKGGDGPGRVAGG